MGRIGDTICHNLVIRPLSWTAGLHQQRESIGKIYFYLVDRVQVCVRFH
jgi:hypothetical protein